MVRYPLRNSTKVHFSEALAEENKKYGGTDLLSHNLADAVPLTLEGLTAVFGMGTGVAPPV